MAVTEAVAAPERAERRQRLQVRQLRHHTEPSRFALAVVSGSIVVAGLIVWMMASGGLVQTVAVFGLLIVFLFLLWLALQLWRVRLLGAAVRVSAESFPDLQATIDEVRERLDYRRRVDVYVVDKNKPAVTLTHYFGVRVLVIEGGAIADLTQPEPRAQLIYMLATYFGAMKARHSRWTPLLVALEMIEIPRIFNLFLYPWFRATVYTGDQIAYVCCGDLDVSVAAVHRVMVGRDIVPQLRADGLVAQSSKVRRSWILRLAQLFMHEPHPTNRYLNVLAFASEHEPSGLMSYRSALSAPAASSFDGVLRYVRPRRSKTWLAPCGGALAVCILIGGMAIGWWLRSDGPYGRDDGTIEDSDYDYSFLSTTTTATSSSAIPTSTSASGGATTKPLASRVPLDLRAACSKSTLGAGEMTGHTDSAYCRPVGAGTPDEVWYVAFATNAGLDSQFAKQVGGTRQGACQGWTSWSDGTGSTRGSLACYRAQNGSNVIVWTVDSDNVLVVAQSRTMDLSALYRWWQGHSSLAAG